MTEFTDLARIMIERNFTPERAMEEWDKTEAKMLRERLAEYKELLELCHTVLVHPCNMESIENVIAKLKANGIGETKEDQC